jgi:hypothetical protein
MGLLVVIWLNSRRYRKGGYQAGWKNPSFLTFNSLASTSFYSVFSLWVWEWPNAPLNFQWPVTERWRCLLWLSLSSLIVASKSLYGANSRLFEVPKHFFAQLNDTSDSEWHFVGKKMRGYLKKSRICPIKWFGRVYFIKPRHLARTVALVILFHLFNTVYEDFFWL